MYNNTKHYINGEWIDGISQETVDVINPATEEVFGQVGRGTKEDVDRAVEAAKEAFIEYRTWSVDDRVELLDRIIDGYEARKEDIIETIRLELGSPVTKAEEVHWQAGMNHFVAARDALKSFQFDERRGNHLVTKEPIGVVGLITPWNFPTNQTSLKIGAALAAGCTMVLKPALNTPMAAIILAEIIDAAGAPKGVFNLVNGKGSEVGDAISTHKDVTMVSFTGSGVTGSKIMENCSKDFKKVSLELGGKSAYVILEDADLKASAQRAVRNVMNNSGQVCSAGTRTLVPSSVYDAFVEEVLKEVDSVVVGDTKDKSVEMGPLVSLDQYETVQQYIQKGIDEGAELIAGGLGKPEGLEKGYYAKPTVFSKVDNQMAIAQEEIFGPVMSLIAYDDVEEAIEIANDSVYGLAGYVEGSDLEQKRYVARSIRTGVVMIDGVPRDPMLPFGGYKQSGIGREWGDYGIEEYLEVKSITAYYDGE